MEFISHKVAVLRGFLRTERRLGHKNASDRCRKNSPDEKNDSWNCSHHSYSTNAFRIRDVVISIAMVVVVVSVHLCTIHYVYDGSVPANMSS